MLKLLQNVATVVWLHSESISPKFVSVTAAIYIQAAMQGMNSGGTRHMGAEEAGMKIAGKDMSGENSIKE